MERRDFLKMAGIALAGTAAGSLIKPINVHAKKRIRWRMASSFPKAVDVIYGGGKTICDLVREMTDGMFDIRIYAAGELVPGLKVFDAVQEGAIQAGHTTLYYYIGKHPAFAFGTAVPFGLIYRQQEAWLHQGNGNKLINSLASDFNLITFPAGNTGAQMGGWYRKPIRSLKDLKGLRMRIPGLGGKVMARLGVSVQVLAGGDIYPALERGALDATEWVGPYDDEKLGFYKVAKYYYYPGWWEPAPSIHLVVNKKAWENLPKEYQEVLRAAARIANVKMMAQYDVKNPPALKRLLEKGVKLERFPDDVIKAAKKEAFDLYEEIASKDATYRKIFEDWKKFKKETSSWLGLNEFAMETITFKGV
ncbi:Extracellular solute-binding protein, family 7 [Thermodesulfatator indicus DSM 15286]|uniref:Extracellular solute-binding protein, family 7 n=1 Tax=Thermodesulfatator indicus (strain DSM 15286 / JCM 11887 / CIR29812) TaxID=667014 RepID=F8AD11_THEID|nr:TRAP transporter substrate-binding protein [Thermodesulfatator indicus]AEH45877.1 Extracellular solute-binding protein, family 7 [Thermodesulfatator indicus DSM 15286]